MNSTIVTLYGVQAVVPGNRFEESIYCFSRYLNATEGCVIGFEIRAVMLGVSSFFRVSHSKEEHYPWITVGISTGNLPQEC